MKILKNLQAKDASGLKLQSRFSICRVKVLKLSCCILSLIFLGPIFPAQAASSSSVRFIKSGLRRYVFYSLSTQVTQFLLPTAAAQGPITGGVTIGIGALLSSLASFERTAVDFEHPAISGSLHAIQGGLQAIVGKNYPLIADTAVIKSVRSAACFGLKYIQLNKKTLPVPIKILYRVCFPLSTGAASVGKNHKYLRVPPAMAPEVVEFCTRVGALFNECNYLKDVLGEDTLKNLMDFDKVLKYERDVPFTNLPLVSLIIIEKYTSNPTLKVLAQQLKIPTLKLSHVLYGPSPKDVVTLPSNDLTTLLSILSLPETAGLLHD